MRIYGRGEERRGEASKNALENNYSEVEFLFRSGGGLILFMDGGPRRDSKTKSLSFAVFELLFCLSYLG